MTSLPSRVALVRRPSSRLDEGLTTHIEKTGVDVRRAQAQWDGYVTAMIDAGWGIEEVPPAEDCPDSVFVEDSVVMFGAVAVLARSGAESRRGETASTSRTLEQLGYEPVAITGEGTLRRR